MAGQLLYCSPMKLSPRSFFAIGVAAALICGVSPPAAAQQGGPKLDRVLQNAHGGKHQRVIVRFRTGADASVERTVLSTKENRILSRHASIGAFTAELRGDRLAALANDPDVESIGVDADVSAFASSYDTSISSNVLRNTLGENEASKGAGIGVAVIDSGIAPLAAFNGRLTASYDVRSGIAIPTLAGDEYGHGTHVAGLIGANDSNYMGVAPSVTFVSLKVLDKNGKGTTSSVIAALEFAVANRQRFNIQVVNLSLGHPILSPAAADPLVQAVESAVRAGLIVVVSAGNVGVSQDTNEVAYAGVTSPGNAPSAITVGAVNTQGTVTHADDDVARYSSRGPTWYDGFVKPDVVAPGHAMISVTDVNSYLFKQYPTADVMVNRKWYLRLNGTSMATAVTTGVVATVLESHNWATSYYGVNPGPLKANGVKAMLQYTALPIRRADGSMPDALTEGTGEVNGEGSVRLAWMAVTMWANPAIATQYPMLLTTTTMIGNAPLDWAARIIWGQQSVSGAALAVSSTAWATNILWGDNIIWGENLLWGDNIIWGENLVWGENIIWGENLVWGENIIWGESLVDANSKVLGQNVLGK